MTIFIKNKNNSVQASPLLADPHHHQGTKLLQCAWDKSVDASYGRIRRAGWQGRQAQGFTFDRERRCGGALPWHPKDKSFKKQNKFQSSRSGAQREPGHRGPVSSTVVLLSWAGCNWLRILRGNVVCCAPALEVFPPRLTQGLKPFELRNHKNCEKI